MRRYQRQENTERLSEAVFAGEVEATEKELFDIMIEWQVRRFEKRDHDPDCMCHDWTAWQCLEAIRAYRAFMKRYIGDEPDIHYIDFGPDEDELDDERERPRCSDC